MRPQVRSLGFMKKIAMAVAATALLAGAGYAGDAPKDDPAAIAATYEKQAAEYRASADKHDNIAKMHRGGTGSAKMSHESVVRHCQELAKNLRAAAAESEALAAEYRKQAAK